MSLYDDDRYNWRETYFVLFDPKRRPRATEIQAVMRAPFRILEEHVNPEGMLRSLTIASYEDHAAVEIRYREGDAVAAEIGALVETLEKGASPRERERLQKAKRCRGKLDVLHFEQTAGTSEFKVLKMPELRFGVRKDPGRGAFPKEQRSDKLPGGSRSDRRPPTRGSFRFDPDSYENCSAADDYDDPEVDSAEDSSVYERLDPNTLVLVLEILCRLTDGIAIDPASGVVI